MSDREALQAFFDKSQTEWPEWALAEVFVPVSQREVARVRASTRSAGTAAACTHSRRIDTSRAPNGTCPPTRPVLPPCGTNGMPASAQAAQPTPQGA